MRALAVVVALIVASALALKAVYWTTSNAQLSDVISAAELERLAVVIETSKSLSTPREFYLEAKPAKLCISVGEGRRCRVLSLARLSTKGLASLPLSAPVVSTSRLLWSWSNGSYSGLQSSIRVEAKGNLLTLTYFSIERTGLAKRFEVWEEIEELRVLADKVVVEVEDVRVGELRGLVRIRLVKKVIGG